MQHGPVDRRAAAVFWQQRSMDVEGPQRGQTKNLLADHIPVIDREDQIGLERADFLQPLRRGDLFGREDRHCVFAGGLGRCLEPDLFVRVVLVGEQTHNVVAPLQQEGQAGVSHLAVAKKEDAGPGGHGLLSRISRMW